MIRKLNPKIENFLVRKTELEAVNLPQNYPEPDAFEEFQTGYKIHGQTGESLTGNSKGDFKESWYVICSNYCNDPFFIDFSEEEKQFPVYFAFHGAGNWSSIKVAEHIEEFSNHLLKISQIEHEREKVISYLTEHFDLKNEFWKEVFLEFTEKEDTLFEVQEEDWILGKIMITDMGVNKLKLINILKQEFRLTPQEALSLNKQTEIEFKKGYLKHLQRDIQKLHELGAKALFKPDEEQV